MPRWPIILFGVAFYYSAPPLIATLFTVSACAVWFGLSKTYRHAIPLLVLFIALTWEAMSK